MAKLALILMFMMVCLCGFSLGGNMIQSTTIPLQHFNFTDISSIELFCIEENGVPMTALIIETQGSITVPGSDLLYINSSWTDLKYGDLLNAFVKDEHLYVVRHKFESDEIIIHRIQQSGGLVSAICIKGTLAEQFVPGAIKNVIPVQGQNNSYYLLTARWVLPAHPGEFLRTVLSAGHGIYYVKPILIEVQDGKLSKPRKLRYGGKIDESFYIKEVVSCDNLVHFLGFRHPEVHGAREKRPAETLHHVAYDLKKKKVTQANSIYTDTPRVIEESDKWINCFYRDISMDAAGDNVFVAFSWEKSYTTKIQKDEYHESSIFYWDYNQGKAGEVEKIADGFHPLVKADSLGNVHLLYINDKANLMHKVERKGIWQKEDVLVDRVDVKDGKLFLTSFAAAFDKDNNLHVVYPSGGNLVHAVVKVN